MREDEIEALLAIDNAGLEVNRTHMSHRDPTLIWMAVIRIPKDFHKANRPDNHAALAFSGEGTTRQHAVANVWQKYQTFVSTEAGISHVIDANGQIMFRV